MLPLIPQIGNKIFIFITIRLVFQKISNNSKIRINYYSLYLFIYCHLVTLKQLLDYHDSVFFHQEVFPL